jgi:hypothetical protein
MRKVYVKVTARLIINMDEGVEVGDVIDEMDYSFTSQTDGADIVETEILASEIEDSK